MNQLGANTALILRLHRDLIYPIHQPGERLDIAIELRDQLRQLIAARGLIFLGYSMSEPRIESLLDKRQNIWCVNPVPPPESLRRAFELPLERCIEGEDALFDNFVQGVSLELLNQALADRRLFDSRAGSVLRSSVADFSSYRGRIDPLVEQIVQDLSADTLDEGDVVALTHRLLGHILAFARGGRKVFCFFFIHDPDAPGGREIHAIIDRDPGFSRQVAAIPCGAIHIKGRLGVSGLQRGVKNVDFQDGSLADYDSLIIVDSMFLSGNTLRIVRQYLIDHCEARPE